MELVLSSAPITHYGVIINKMEPEELALLMEDSSAQDLVKTALMNGLPTKSLYFHFNVRKSDLAGKTNLGLQLDEDLLAFIQHVPDIEIKADEVKDIKAEQFEAMTEQFEKIIAQ